MKKNDLVYDLKVREKPFFERIKIAFGLIFGRRICFQTYGDLVTAAKGHRVQPIGYIGL